MIIEPSRRTARITQPWQRYFLAPVLLLAFISCGSVFSRSAAGENPPKLKGSVSKVERLQSWIRERAIDKLPWSTTNKTEDYDHEVRETYTAMKTWAAQSSDHENQTNIILVDVISIGSSSRMDYLYRQRGAWASPTFVRNMFMATEMNTDRSIIGDSSCQALELSCAEPGVDSNVQIRSRWLQTKNSSKETAIVAESNETHVNATTASTEFCVQRRLGLAMGVSIRSYRKIIHSFKLRSEILGDGINILPSFLLVTFDQMAYNTTELTKCEVKESSQIYAPSLSLKQLEGKSQDNVFPYPTNRTGLIFNRAAIERWILQVSCSPIDTQSYASESFESNFCCWMKDANQSKNEFDSALIRSLAFSNITGVMEQNQAMSLSDLFYKYSYSMHLLCSSQHGVVPSGEEMIGYLIHRFKISDSPISENECMSKVQDISS
mmetsp:Transcript_23919/g.39432  ORF Transcript_23919/g.39432 Transcript_23919/m.39432 type:complete len:436 (-) Transcript_23919:862-2169(-)